MSKVIGLDLGATHLRGGLFDQKGNLLKKEKIKSKVENEEKEKIKKRVIEFIQNLKGKEKIEALGIGVPGPINFKKGLILNPPNIPHLHNFLLKGILKKEFKIPVFLDNDANSALLGERWKGVAKNLENAIMLTLGTGIGGGILINGEIYRGSSGSGGELGHMIIKSKIVRCHCGQVGCLEALIQKDRENELEYLVSALISLYNIFEPEAIIVSGGWANQKLLKSLKAKIPSKIKLVLAKLGEWSGVYGAAYGALKCLSH